MDEHNRTTAWVSRLHDVELDASTPCDFVTLHHLPPLLTLLPDDTEISHGRVSCQTRWTYIAMGPLASSIG